MQKSMYFFVINAKSGMIEMSLWKNARAVNLFDYLQERKKAISGAGFLNLGMKLYRIKKGLRKNNE